MKIGIDNALGIHPHALELRSARTQALARNIANADTPGFKARDIDFHKVLAEQTAGLKPTTIAKTHAKHLDGASRLSTTQLQYRIPLMPSLDGNSVDMQLEQAEFAQNSMQFLASLRFVNGRLQGLLTAIKGE